MKPEILPANCRRWLGCGAVVLGFAGAFVPVLLLLPASLWPLSALLCVALYYLAIYDARHQLLPNVITVPLIAVGLVFHWLVLPMQFSSALIGAIAGYAVLVAVNVGYRALRGRDGIGMGDAKLLAAAGAWLGWAALPWLLLVASVSGLLFAASTMIVRRQAVAMTTRMPFGPFLAFAFWLLWLARHWPGSPGLA